MKVLYLHAEVMGYTMATIRALVDRGVEVHIVHWDHRKLTPYTAPELPGVFLYNRSEMSVADMQQLANRVAPALTVVCGWMDRGYLHVVRSLRARGGIVLTGFDDQWFGTFRQRGAAQLARFGVFSRYFSHAWVSGAYQFEFARRLGFEKERIVFDLLAADLGLFEASFRAAAAGRARSYPHSFWYVGRLEPIKGLDTLISAWSGLGARKRDWTLRLAGDGSLAARMASIPGVVVRGFMEPNQLAHELAGAGCFILPSRAEPWGVVMHECAAAGLPLISSDVVGAASAFLIPGWNGYSFRVNDAADLAKRMSMIVEAPDTDLAVMGERSHHLAQRITPATSAASLLSAVCL